MFCVVQVRSLFPKVFDQAVHLLVVYVQVVTPTGNTLVENLTLKIEPGSNLLITGRFSWI